MNKTDLINKISGEVGINKVQAGRALDSFISNTIDAVSKGNSVTLVGFGTFKKVKRAARTGRNPQTGATINIPARNVAKFKAGKGFSIKVK